MREECSDQRKREGGGNHTHTQVYEAHVTSWHTFLVSIPGPGGEGPCPWSGVAGTPVSALSPLYSGGPGPHTVEDGAALLGERVAWQPAGPRQETRNDGFQALALARREEGHRSCCQGKAVPRTPRLPGEGRRGLLPRPWPPWGLKGLFPPWRPSCVSSLPRTPLQSGGSDVVPGMGMTLL